MRAWLLFAVLCVGPLQAQAQAQGQAQAQQWPARPLRVLVPSAAGGAGDIVARAVGQKLTEAWGQQVIVDNRNGIVGAEITAHAAPDGYTIMFSTSALSIRDSVYRQLPFNTLRDFAPVGQVVSQSNVLVAHPGLPVKSVQELIAYARARPGELNYGSSGNASSNHLAGELFKLLTKVNFVHVPYKGLPQAVTDLLGGRLQIVFGSPSSTLPAARDGKLRLLAVTTPKRSPALPEVPTIAESGVPGYEFTGWIGVFLPVRTPEAIVNKLSREVARIVQLPELKQRFAADATESVGSTPEEYAAFLKAEIARWTRVARAANIQVD
jgi:tripartite-type tricarboxylate transporter receptor subunit TctC